MEKGSGKVIENGKSSQSVFIRVAGVASLIGGILYLVSVIVHPQGYARAVVPLSIIFMLMGVLGLHVLLWKREGRIGLIGFLLVIVGLLLGVVGMAGSALGVLNPNPVAPIINTGEHLGLVCIGAGMLCWGIVTLKERALGNWSILPMILGIFGLSGIFFVNPGFFATLERAGVQQLFAVCWGLLGYALVASQTKKSLKSH
jgi:hypothetical protein